MKKQVMVIVEDDLYNNKPVLTVKSIMKVQKGDKSVPNQIVQEEPTQQQMSPPSESEFSKEKIESAVDESPQESESSPGEAPPTSSIPDDF